MDRQKSTARPTCSWIAVTDAQGRTRMEARWLTAPTSVARAA